MPSHTRPVFTPVTQEEEQKLNAAPVHAEPSVEHKPAPDIKESVQHELEKSDAQGSDNMPAGAFVNHKPSRETSSGGRTFGPEFGSDGRPLPAADALDKAIAAAEDKKKADAATTKPEVKPEAKPESKPEPEKLADVQPAKPTATEATPVEEPEASEEELLQFLKPKAARRFRKILARTKELEAKDTENAAKIKELSEKASAPQGDPKATEELNKLREEVTKFRRQYEIDSDPEVRTRFDAPVEQAETDITSVLKNYGFRDETFKAIKDEGGFAAFSRSKNKLTLGDGREVTCAELTREWLQGMTPGDSTYVTAKMAHQFESIDAKKRFVAEEKASAAEHFKKIASDRANQGTQALESAKKAQDQYKAWSDGIKKSKEFQDHDVPDSATPAEKEKAANEQ